jgi:hypothetical protein
MKNLQIAGSFRDRGFMLGSRGRELNLSQTVISPAYPFFSMVTHAMMAKRFTEQCFVCSWKKIIMNNNKRLSTIELKFTGCAEDPFARALKKQMELHEGVTFMDLLKFLYQSSLGSFHLFELMEETELKEWVRRNLENAKPSDGSLTEELYGKKWIRVNFGPYKRKFGNDYQRIYEVFGEARRMKHGQTKEYTDLLKKLLDAIKESRIRPLTEEPTFLSLVETFLEEYEEEGFPPIHHSPMYMKRNSCEYLVVPNSSLDKII